MAYLAVNKDGSEIISYNHPWRTDSDGGWEDWDNIDGVDIYYQTSLPKGSILKLIDKELTWEDEPVEI